MGLSASLPMCRAASSRAGVGQRRGKAQRWWCFQRQDRKVLGWATCTWYLFPRSPTMSVLPTLGFGNKVMTCVTPAAAGMFLFLWSPKVQPRPWYHHRTGLAFPRALHEDPLCVSLLASSTCLHPSLVYRCIAPISAFLFV